MPFGLSLASPFCLPCDGSGHWSFIVLLCCVPPLVLKNRIETGSDFATDSKTGIQIIIFEKLDPEPDSQFNLHMFKTRKLTKTFENVHLKQKKLEWGLTCS